jgi:hypothetical protein
MQLQRTSSSCPETAWTRTTATGHDLAVADVLQSVWFPDETGRNDQERAFLDQLRLQAASWRIEDVSPGDTSSERWLTPLYIDVEVPRITIPRSTLQVAYWTSGPYGSALHGTWGDGYLMDDHDGNDPEDLTVVGVLATPEQYATWAADWLLRQLHRPVIREEWLRHDRVVATTWRLADTGHILGKTGLTPRRLLRRKPDRAINVR